MSQNGKKLFDKENTILYYLDNEFSLTTYTGVDNAGRKSASVVFGFYNKYNPIETNRILTAFVSCVNSLSINFDSEKQRLFTDENKILCKEALDKLRQKL